MISAMHFWGLNQDLIEQGTLGIVLAISIGVNVVLFKRLQKCQAEKILILERDMVARETMINRYHESKRETDRLISDLMRFVPRRASDV